MESHNSFSHSFVINEISYVGTSFKRPVNNELDFHGTLLSTPRLPEERNAAYKKRLLDTYTNRASSTYTGLINGMTRELGLELFSPVEFTFIATDAGDFPQIEFSDSVVRVWKSVFDDAPELTIDRSDKSKLEYFLTGLVDLINTSTNVIATMADASHAYKRSDSIVNSSSTTLVVSQQIIASKINILGNANIQRDSIVFSNLNNFREEVASKNLVLTRGQYYINYAAGVVHTFDIPEDGFIQYKFRDTTFTPKASPVIIRAVHSDDFKQVMFNKIQLSNNEFAFSSPTDKGSSIINELLSVVPVYWGA